MTDREFKTSKDIIADSYQKYRGGLLCYIYYRIGDYEVAQDLTQDAFVRLLTYEMKLDANTMKSFLFTIASNLVIDYLRHSYMKREKLSYLYDETDPCASAGADSALNVHEALTVYQHGKETLTPRTRKVYEMSFEQNLSITEISERLEITYNTVECHLFMARKQVRAYVRKALAV